MIKFTFNNKNYYCSYNKKSIFNTTKNFYYFDYEAKQLKKLKDYPFRNAQGIREIPSGYEKNNDLYNSIKVQKAAKYGKDICCLEIIKAINFFLTGEKLEFEYNEINKIISFEIQGKNYELSLKTMIIEDLNSKDTFKFSSYYNTTIEQYEHRFSPESIKFQFELTEFFVVSINTNYDLNELLNNQFNMIKQEFLKDKIKDNNLKLIEDTFERCNILKILKDYNSITGEMNYLKDIIIEKTEYEEEEVLTSIEKSKKRKLSRKLECIKNLKKLGFDTSLLSNFGFKYNVKRYNELTSYDEREQQQENETLKKLKEKKEKLLKYL